MTKPALLVAILAALGCEGEKIKMGFFDNFKPTELGTTKLVEPSPILGNRGDWQMMLNLHAPDADATQVMIAIRSEYSINQPVVAGMASTGIAALGGPLVCRVTFGVGGAYQIFEFDVPPSRVPANFAPIIPAGGPSTQPVNDIGDGVNVIVSGASILVELRNDANLGSLTGPGTTRTNISTTPVKALAFVTPATSSSTPVRRNILVAGGLPNAPLLPGITTVLTIPSLSQRVRFPRSPRPQIPLHIVTTDAFGNNVRHADIPVNDDGLLELSARELIMTIRNDGAVNAVLIQALFDVEP